MDLYILYKTHARVKSETLLATAYKDELSDKFEKSFPYEKLILLRTIATKKFEFEQL